jgi:hypothetical protein
MTRYPILLAWAALLVFAGPLGAGEKKKKPDPDLPKHFSLADDFEDGDLRPLVKGLWFAWDDKKDGGSSTVDGPKIVDRSDKKGKCLELGYVMGEKFTKRSGKKEDPSVVLGLSMGDKILKGWQDLTAYYGISFEAKTEGDFVVVMITHKEKKQSIHYHSFAAEKKWRRYFFPFEDFVPIESLYQEILDPKEYPLHLQNCILIAIRPAFSIKPKTRGKIRVDNFGYMAKDRKERMRELKETEKVVYGDLVILKPKKYWTWKDSELKNPGKAVSMHFVSFRMHNDWQVPFPNGYRADPSNYKQMGRGTVLELERRGLRNIRQKSHKRVTLREFKSHRFVFDAQVGPELMKGLRALGLETPDFYVQVDFIKYRSVMYEVLTFIHAKTAADQLPRVNWILHNLRKWRKGK